jgi:hypothetical protein
MDVNDFILIAIFKNESHILKEWVEHYFKEGVDLICLIDNGSTDNYIDILEPYIKRGKVILNIDNTKHRQAELYNKYYLDIAKQFNWVLVIDLDEFMYSRNNYNTIKKYLTSQHESVFRISVPWKLYGSSGHINQPDSVIQNFVKRQNYNYETQIEVKSIIRGNKLVKLSGHDSYLINETTINCTDKISEVMLSKSILQLNHYTIQSLEFFLNVKQTRGDVLTANCEHVRNMDYFNRYDYKDNTDDELKYKLYI